MTNSPTFDWHMTNLRNYINLKPNDVGHIDIGKVDLGQFGAGSGMHGLPGDFTPPSRFVRAVALLEVGACVGHRTASHPAGVPLFSTISIFRSARSASPKRSATIPEYTTWTAASDLRRTAGRCGTFADQSITSVDHRGGAGETRGPGFE